MKGIYLLALISLISSNFSKNNYYTLNLDEIPEKRWITIVNAKRNQIMDFYKEFMRLVKLKPLYLQLIKNKVSTLNNEYIREMKGIGKELNIDLNTIYLVNLITEITSSCTAIPFQPLIGNPLLAKNLDVGGNTSSIIDVFIDIEVIKDGKVLFRAPGVAGLVGLANGLKPKSFALTLNNRYDKETAKMISAILRNYTPVMWAMRKSLELCDNYDCTISYLSNQKLISGIYYVIVGVDHNQGVSIARNRSKTELENHLNNSNWFLVQTNSDLNKIDPDGRRTIGTIRMHILGQNYSNLETVQSEILQRIPNFVPNVTRATILFDPSKEDYTFTVYKEFTE